MHKFPETVEKICYMPLIMANCEIPPLKCVVMLHFPSCMIDNICSAVDAAIDSTSDI